MIKLGVERLEYAAQRGEAEAAALLADYYASRAGKKAHALYTKPGALAMDQERKENFRMLKEKRRGRVIQLVLLPAVVNTLMKAKMIPYRYLKGEENA